MAKKKNHVRPAIKVMDEIKRGAISCILNNEVP
jgi:hypothetical protein